VLLRKSALRAATKNTNAMIIVFDIYKISHAVPTKRSCERRQKRNEWTRNRKQTLNSRYVILQEIG
jgi:hypothetical protein